MFNSLDDLWAWLFGPSEPEVETPSETEDTIGNHNSIPETTAPQHNHLPRNPVMKNKE